MIPWELDGISLTRRGALVGVFSLVLSFIGFTELTDWYRISTAGASPDEYVPDDCGEQTVELVQTRDSAGDPATTKEIPAERHRRLALAEELSIATLQQNYDGLDDLGRISVKPRSDNPCDLALVLHVEDLHDDYPTEIEDVPVVYAYSFESESRPIAGSPTSSN